MGDLFYLHEYIEGQPDMSHSCGFVKFCRQTGWMMSKNVNISINVRGLYSHGTAKDGVYALVPESSGSTGAVRLCDLNVSNGFGKTECLADGENISGSGFEWDDVMGIAVISDGLAIPAAVLWENEESNISDIIYGVTKKRILTEHTAEPEDKAKNKEKYETEGKLGNQENKEKFERIDGNFVDAFDDDDFYDCMEVTPEQLQQIFDARLQQSELGGAFGTMQENSFLMHGYFTFRHILVAKVHNDPDLLFVGVPGVYNNKERFMASMFNFNNFKRSHRSDCRNPYFGYWYQTI